MVKNITIPFLTEPNEKLHVLDIARKMNMPHPTARLQLQKLEKEGILKKSYKGRLTLYELNKSHPNLIDYASIAETEKLIEACKQPLMRELIFLLRNTTEKPLLLFGSAAENLSKAGDIDLLLIGKTQKKDFQKIEEKIGKSIHLIQLARFADISAALKEEIRKKHLIISGTDYFLRRLLW